MDPKKAIERLKEGNTRFVNGLRSVEPLLAHKKMPDLAEKGQKPFAIILTCSDSRSPAEMIFDQGVGDLFVVRVAGNVVAPSLLASIEFAIANFGSSCVLVLGHTSCGAIKATCSHVQDPSRGLPSPHLEELVGRIRPAVEATALEINIGNVDFEHRATLQNIRRSMRLIEEQSQIVRNAVEKGVVSVQGAILNIANGAVNFL